MKVDYKNVMDIQLASSDEAIAACYRVMRELRPLVGERSFCHGYGPSRPPDIGSPVCAPRGLR